MTTGTHAVILTELLASELTGPVMTTSYEADSSTLPAGAAYEAAVAPGMLIPFLRHW
jgi:hypothetical protein